MAVLVEQLHGRTINRHGRDTLIKALTGVVNDTDIDIISQLVEEIEMQQRHKDEAQKKMTSLCEEWFPKELENLQTISGVESQLILKDGVPYQKPSDNYSTALPAVES